MGCKIERQCIDLRSAVTSIDELQEHTEAFYRYPRLPDWYLLYESYISADSGVLVELHTKLNEKLLSVKDTDITYRLINHWAEKGLISDDRESQKGWRKLSILDAIWTHVLVELRKYGMPLESLGNAFRTTFWQGGITDRRFEVAVALCLQRELVLMITFDDGASELFRKKDFNYALSLGSLAAKSYVTINLNKCVEAVTSRGHAELNYSPPLSETEQETIDLVRSGDFDRIELLLKNGTPIKLSKIKKQQKGNLQLDGLAQAIEYGEMKVKISDGKIQIIESKGSE